MPYDAICLQTLHDCAPPWEGRLRRERLIGEVLVPLIAPGGGYLGGKFKKKKEAPGNHHLQFQVRATKRTRETRQC